MSHPLLAQLHPTGNHPESGVRIDALLERFAGHVEAVPATREDVERCHHPAYVAQVAATTEARWLDGDTICTPSSWQAALLAAGAAVQAADLGGFALARPPGHHALPGRAMGFCLVDSVAVAARWAQAAQGVGRVAILDWDVHHGNGTQAIFADDPSVMFVSLHQWPFYPGSGGPDEQGETLVNVPLAAGSGDDAYLAAWDERVAPAVERFEPELVLVSAGFDAHEADPLAQMQVTADGFRELARRSAALAPRIGAVLEGGYNPDTLPELVDAALEGFSGN